MNKLLSSNKVVRDTLYAIANEGYLEIVDNFSFYISAFDIKNLIKKCNMFVYPFGCIMSYETKVFPNTNAKSDTLSIRKYKHKNMYENVDVSYIKEDMSSNCGYDEKITLAINNDTKIEMFHKVYEIDPCYYDTIGTDTIQHIKKKELTVPSVFVIVEHARKFVVDKTCPLIYNALMVGIDFEILSTV